MEHYDGEFYTLRLFSPIEALNVLDDQMEETNKNEV